ncbi:MAG: DNA polymerase III subunit beta [Candidatus Dasytiphilus stammeri]
MKFTIKREQLLKPLQQTTRTISNKPLLPIINNILLKVSQGTLWLTSTDLEIEMKTHLLLTEPYEPGLITVPARKLLEICRCLPANCDISASLKQEQMLLTSGNSKFYLATLSADNFPNLDDFINEIEFTINQNIMKHLIEATAFSMARQDVRYYLNGLLLEVNGRELCTVATDGHRLSFCKTILSKSFSYTAIIIPRKTVIEILRLLENNEQLLKIKFSKNHMRLYLTNCIITSRIIDGQFPNYRTVLQNNYDKLVLVEADLLRSALSRAYILANERLHGVCLDFKTNRLKITATNMAQEKAEELVDVIYKGEHLSIIINVRYLLDVLQILKDENIQIFLIDSESSIQIKRVTIYSDDMYVIMPMQL